MTVPNLKNDILRTLLYFEIFDHALSPRELLYLLPRNSVTKSDLEVTLSKLVDEGVLQDGGGLFHLPNDVNHGLLRRQREKLARKRMIVARFMGHIIKRFPFVRGIFISGDLSKGVASLESDIDYVIVVQPRRIWICRTLLVLFKKVFLLNSKKYFCLNYFVDSDNLTFDDQNYYSAVEIVYLKPLYNFSLYLRYLNSNSWIQSYFPNYQYFALSRQQGNLTDSVLQKILEVVIIGRFADRLDHALMEIMKRVWKKRYPEYDEETRERLFRSTTTESRAYAGNFASKIFSIYEEKLRRYQLVE